MFRTRSATRCSAALIDVGVGVVGHARSPAEFVDWVESNIPDMTDLNQRSVQESEPENRKTCLMNPRSHGGSWPKGDESPPDWMSAKPQLP